MVSNEELRARARAGLGGPFQKNWLYGVLAFFIYSVILSISANLIVLPLIISGPLSIGLSAYFLGFARRREGAAESLDAFTKPFSENLGSNILMGVLTNVYVFLWSMLFVIPGIVKFYSYAMAPYIKHDHPEYSVNQAISESKRMMKGHRFELFLLDLSFIGWFLVGYCACGIGLLWVMAYVQAARAEFYEELWSRDSINSSFGNSTFGTTATQNPPPVAEEEVTKRSGGKEMND